MRTRARKNTLDSTLHSTQHLSPSSNRIESINQSDFQDDLHSSVHRSKTNNTNKHHNIPSIANEPTSKLKLDSNPVESNVSATTSVTESLSGLSVVSQAVIHKTVEPKFSNSHLNSNLPQASTPNVIPDSASNVVDIQKQNHDIDKSNQPNDEPAHIDGLNDQPFSISDQSLSDITTNESRVKQLSALFQRVDQISSSSSFIYGSTSKSTRDPGSASSPNLDTSSTGEQSSQRSRSMTDQSYDSKASPRKPRSAKILNLVAIFEKENNIEKRSKSVDEESTDQSTKKDDGGIREDNHSDKRTQANPAPEESPTIPTESIEYQNSGDPNHNQSSSTISEQTKIQENTPSRKIGPEEPDLNRIRYSKVEHDHEEYTSACSSEKFNPEESLDKDRMHSAAPAPLDVEQLATTEEVELSINREIDMENSPQLKVPVENVDRPRTSTAYVVVPNSSSQSTSTRAIKTNYNGDQANSLLKHSEEFNPNKSFVEADSCTLGLSQPVEISTKSVRAERVANALERIGKRVEQFSEDCEDDGLAPRDSIIPLMIESMQHHRDDCKVADRALSTFRRLTVSDTCRSKIGECGGIEVVVDIMRCHLQQVRIQTQACLTLANLTYENEANKEEVVRCGGLQAVVAALSKHKTEENVQAWGCLAIRNFTNYSGPRTHDATFSSNAVSVLLCALEEYPQSFMVQQNGLIALVNIASASTYGLERIRDEGGVVRVIECMSNNRRSEKLSEVALCLSRLLVEDKRAQIIFGQHKGIEAITSVMDEYSTHVGIAVKGCATFRNLAFQRENRDLLGKCGSLRSIVNALNIPFSAAEGVAADVDAVSYFLKALSNVTFDSITNKIQAGRLGSVDAILKLLQKGRFGDNERIVVDAFRALRNLVDGYPSVSQNHRLLLRNKGVAAVRDALQTHGQDSAGVAEHGIAIFVNMSCNRAFANQISNGSGDVIRIVDVVGQSHAQNELVQRQASALLQYAKADMKRKQNGHDNDVERVTQGGTKTIRGRVSNGTHSRSMIPRAVRPNSNRDGRHSNSYKKNTRTPNKIHFQNGDQPPSTDRTVRASKSHHRNEEEQQIRLQRLRSLPLPLTRRGQRPSSSRHGT